MDLTAVVAEICGEEWGVQVANSVGEKGLLRSGRDSVEAVKGQANKSVIGRVRGERGGHLLGQLNSLTCHSQASDSDSIRVNVAG